MPTYAEKVAQLEANTLNALLELWLEKTATIPAALRDPTRAGQFKSPYATGLIQKAQQDALGRKLHAEGRNLQQQATQAGLRTQQAEQDLASATRWGGRLWHPNVKNLEDKLVSHFLAESDLSARADRARWKAKELGTQSMRDKSRLKALLPSG